MCDDNKDIRHSVTFIGNFDHILLINLVFSKETFTRSRSAMETLEKDVKYVQI